MTWAYSLRSSYLSNEIEFEDKVGKSISQSRRLPGIDDNVQGLK